MAAPDSQKPDENDADRLRAVAKYSGLGFQMLAIIGLGAFAGLRLDAYFRTRTPWFTIGLMLLGVVVALYQVIRSLTRE